MRSYENLMILKPDVDEESGEQFLSQITELITQNGGTLDEVDKWGVRKLAYRIDKFSEGYYLLLKFQCHPDLVLELERRLRVIDLVLKFLTSRTDERMKRVEKRQAARSRRESRKPSTPVGAPAAYSPSEPTEQRPGAPSPGMPTADESGAESAEE